MKNTVLNKKCIVRGDRSGVFFGKIVNISDDFKVVEIANCRRIWYWAGADSCSDLAIGGVTRPENCRFTKSVERLVISDAIEINVCTDKAIQNLEAVPEWTLQG